MARNFGINEKRIAMNAAEKTVTQLTQSFTLFQSGMPVGEQVRELSEIEISSFRFGQSSAYAAKPFVNNFLKTEDQINHEFNHGPHLYDDDFWNKMEQNY